MSMESAKAFIERLKVDGDFATKVAQCKDDEARMALAKEHGFNFTADEIKKVSSELLGRNTRYGWLARPYPTGTFTLSKVPSFAWRTNVPYFRRLAP